MSSKKLFSSLKSSKSFNKIVKAVDTVNNAGGIAYSLNEKAALAEGYASCLGSSCCAKESCFVI